MKRAIFISYRRDDAEGEAGRLFDDLVRTYGDDSVFMDVAGIAPGTDFRKAIDDNVSTCGVFLAVIGPNWPNVTSANGERRLDDANDFVRLEISSALARNIAVIPVLVHDARMPRPEQLPENIKDLAYRNSVEISHARWNSDVQLLVAALKQYVTTTQATATDPVHATIPVQLPPPVSSLPQKEAAKSKLPLYLGGAGVALVLLALIGYFALRPDHHRGNLVDPVEVASALPATSGAPPVTPPQQGAAAASAPAGPLAGIWTNPHTKKGNDPITQLKISGTGPQYVVEPFGACNQGLCSWGAKALTFDGTKMQGMWSLGNTVGEQQQRETVILIVPANGKNPSLFLGIETHNRWLNTQGQVQQNGFSYEFVRAQ